MSKHTKGPWEAIQLSERSSWGIYQSGKSPMEEYSLAVLRSHENFNEPHLAIEEQAANAHIIAAAPEMLNVLEDLLRISFPLRTFDSSEDQMEALLREAAQIVKKARGER